MDNNPTRTVAELKEADRKFNQDYDKMVNKLNYKISNDERREVEDRILDKSKKKR